MDYPYLSKNTDGSTATKLMLVVVALAVFAALVYATYAWQRREVDSLNKKVTTLTSQLNEQKNTGTPQQNQTPTQTQTTSYTSSKGVTIKVFRPEKNTTVTSPLIVVGEVPGNWSFEASFPVKLLDSTGKVIAEQPAELLDDWMTENMVPFTVKLSYNSAQVTKGTGGKLVLQKDNPSGLEDKDDSVSIDIRF